MKLKTEQYEHKDIEVIANLLKEGKVVAFPTDTVYGLACIYENEAALKALKESKIRPETKPIPTMVSSIRQMEEIAVVHNDVKKLADEFMPGPLTLILKKKSHLPDYVTNGLDTIGIRMPDDDFILHLIDLVEKPLLVTSANISGEQPGETGEEVLQQLDGRIDAIVMGKARGTASSTIVDMTKDTYKILREGPITEKMIKEELR